jgi:hypothetical protein
MDNPSPFHDVLVDTARHVGRNGEADALGAAAPADDEVIDADHLSVNVDKRST